MSLLDRTDSEILAELGGRLRRYRLQQNVTQEDLSRLAGIGIRTVRNVENGEDTQFSTIIRLLRALGRLDTLDAFLPEAPVSPMELLQTGGRQRNRATGRRRA